ncbi:MAG TPA: autotransporter domain-containing protein, partial [Allosphingosinicella sp.]
TAAPRVQQSFAVTQSSQTISFTSTPPSPALVGGTYTPTATATSGLPVAFTIDPAAAGVCTISGGTVSFTAAGTCVINANQPGNSGFTAAPQAQQSFTVARASQTISFTSTPPSSAQVGSTYTPTATASSGLPVTISIAPSSSGICSMSGGVVTFNAVGTCLINANQAGNVAFAPAPQAQQSIAVSTPAPPQARSLTPAATVRNGPGASVTIDLRPLITGEATGIVVDTPPQQGSVTLNQTAFTATYTPTAGFAGNDSFTFRAVGPGGSSNAASVPIQVISAVPTAQPRQVNVLAGRPITIDLTGSATGAPFTGGALVSVSPADAADVSLVEGGTAAARAYSVQFTSRGAFAGPVTITYTLTNSGGTSAPLTLTVNVESRPDPSTDAEVRGLESAQTGAARRAAASQIRNFGRRMEQLHGDAPSGGVAISVAPGIQMGLGTRTGQSRSDVLYNDPTRLEPVDGYGRPDAGRGSDPGAALVRGTSLAGGGASSADRAAAYGVTGAGAAPGGAAPAPAAADPAVAGAAASAQGEAAAAAARQAGSVELWANGQITVGHRDPVTGQDEFSISTSGITLGADIRIADGATVGVGAGIGRDHTDVGDNGSELRSQSWVVGLYGSFRPIEGTFIDVVLGTGGLDFDITRYVTATGSLVTSERSGDLMFGAVTAGIDRRRRGLHWSLYGGVEALRAELDGYTETGPVAYSLIYDARTVDSLAGLFGGRFELEMESGRSVLLPRGRLEYRYDFEEATGQRVRFSDWLTGPSYLIDADGWSRHRIAAELGLGVRLRNGWMFGFDLLGEVSGNSQTGGVRLEVSRKF